MNKGDPRVDSDRDGSRNVGAAQYGPGGAYNQHGSGLTGNNHGTHGPVGGFATGGPAPNTAGPHKSDMVSSTHSSLRAFVDRLSS